MTKQPESLPGQATAEQGEVMMDGPDGVAVSLTPDAARLTARALRAAARVAQGQTKDVSPPGEHEDGGPDQA